MKLCITGANSSVGQQLLRTLAGWQDVEVTAVLRSSAANLDLPQAPNIRYQACTYADSAALAQACTEADTVIHLAGILFEGKGSNYQSANVDSTAAVVAAAKAAAAKQLLFLSVLGADASSGNPFYRSKGEAEALVENCGLPATNLRVPLLLGPGTAGGQALLREAGSGNAKLLGGGSHVVRPLDVEDLCAAILAVCESPLPGTRTLELCGPEPVTYHALVTRMAQMLGTTVELKTIPVGVARLFAGISHTLKGVGMSPAIIDVITSSENPAVNADQTLGITLTPLTMTLQRLAESAGSKTNKQPNGTTAPLPGKRRANPLGRIVFLLLTLACFVYLYFRLDGAAAREGLELTSYMSQVFASVQWLPWLLLMMAYSVFYFLIDTLVVSRALNWFIGPVRYRDLLPIRGSAYIISLFNEQVGKGAMAWYLNRRDGVPGWEVGSVMLFIMFCEVFYLLVWATAGFFFSSSVLPPVFSLIPGLAEGAALFFTLWLLFFSGKLLPGSKLREGRLLHAFRQARLKHYLLFLLLRSPALLMAVFVYSTALRLFGVEASFLGLLGFLPVIFFAAAVPTPMRAAAITLWVVLFPDNEGQMAAFGFVQHNFFILFNALIGLLFWRRAQRELFGPAQAT
jgi:uncharacterized protein YbjT (DUF2867 family)